jgi:hypothetical protein
VVDAFHLEIDLVHLPVLDQRKLALLTFILGTPEASTLTLGSPTHDAGLQLTAKLVARRCDDEQIKQIIQALLPLNYEGDSLGQIPEWLASAHRKGFDEVALTKLKKPSAAELLHKLFEQSGATLFHDDGKQAYMSVPVDGGGARHIGVRSSEGTLWLTREFYINQGKAISSRSLDEVVGLLEARARFDAPQYQTFLRVGGAPNQIAIDLGHEDGRAVLIEPTGWRVELHHSIKFIRSPGFSCLPIPKRNGDLALLKQLLNLDDESWALVLAFMLTSLRPTGPYMLLIAEGEQGSGKSFLSKVIKRIVDPNQLEKATLPDSERDLMIHAKEFYLLVFDNISGMKAVMSDALCRTSTGGGHATRALYTNGELYVSNFTRPIVVNGIADFANRPDLMERAIPLRLAAIPADRRRTEEEMLLEFERILPGVLGRLYDIVAFGVANVQQVSTPRNIRMADAGRWLIAVEPATGLPSGTLLQAVTRAQDEAFVERAHNEPLVAALLRVVMSGGPWFG